MSARCDKCGTPWATWGICDNCWNEYRAEVFARYMPEAIRRIEEDLAGRTAVDNPSWGTRVHDNESEQ